VRYLEILKSKVKFRIKFWLEFDNKSILGSGWANLLKHLDKNEDTSLTKAAKECNYSYKYAWNILKRIERRTGMTPVETSKGGRGGGGHVKLNEWGKFLLRTYLDLESKVKTLENEIKSEKNLS